jgi:c-di-GMP-binding flagellar brake protein YcgR
MDETRTETRRLNLEVGRTVILHPEGPTGGFPLAVPVDAVAQGEHWFEGSIEPIRQGETLLVELASSKDARYVTEASVSARSDDRFALRIEPIWRRVQQRAFVRMSAHGLTVRVVRPTHWATRIDAHDDPGCDLYDLLDVSAGGIRFASSEDFEAGEEVVCHFELPGSLCFVLPGYVVRPPETSGDQSDKDSVGVEFAELEEDDRSQLLRWVYRERVRAHRESHRHEQRARHLANLRSRVRR